MTIMRKVNNGNIKTITAGTPGTPDDREHRISLPPAQYQALYSERLEISSRVGAHIIWDNDSCRLIILGNEESVRQTAVVLGQYLNLRPGVTSTPLPANTNTDEAKNLLLMSTLPPELTISTHSSSSDSRSRRKLESEDSSYDSDHENINLGLGLEPSLSVRGSLSNSMSKSHDDISRTYSETLALEYSEYVSVKDNEALLFNLGSNFRQKRSMENLSGGGKSRDSSPVQSVKQDSELDNVDKDQYYQKVEFALKLGYPEDLTKKALTKVGMSACQDDLVKELIRLQQSKSFDSEEDLLKESCGQLIKSTQKDAYIKEGALADSSATNLRPIVIDGPNVAMAHGNYEFFSCRGIEICVEWFKNEGHKDITVFVPMWWKESNKPEKPIMDKPILDKLVKEKILIFTPSRNVEGKRIVCHDDRYCLKLALENGGIVVSNDNYREFIKEFKPVIEERILPYAFVHERFMPPGDPLGRKGPSLEVFLRNSTTPSRPGPSSSQPCPYEKKCTYGNKCKYYHPERVYGPHKSVSDKLKEQSKRQIQEVRTRNTSRDSSPGEFIRSKSNNLPLRRTESDQTAFGRKPQPQQQVSRTNSSRPFAPQPLYQDYPKADLTKSKSVENSGRLKQRELRMSSVPSPVPSLEMGCLSSYGLQPPASRPWSQFQQPPPSQHRKLERQLTINPSFDPRINNSPRLTSEAMEYMRKNHPPPPFCLGNISEQSVSPADHQNVTRNASAPDTIKQWRGEVTGGQAGGQVEASSSPHSRSDGQLNKGQASQGPPVNRTFSADPFSQPESSWLSPLSLGTSIWAGPVSPPPTSPSSSYNLGPVGSKPAGGHSDSRAQQFVNLCNIFPARQVQEAMTALPEETDGQVLARKIIEMFPPQNREY